MDYFIVGNGFDIEHAGEKTSYSSFRKWLMDEYSINEDEETYDLPSYSTNYKGLESYDEREFAKLFFTLINNAERIKNKQDLEHKITWNEFENLLGRIDWTSLETGAIEYIDSEGDVNPWKTSDNYALGGRTAFESSHILITFFENWIRQVDLSTVKQKKEIAAFFNTHNLKFINFNYTDILERVYKIKEVLHIHGFINENKELIVGHNNNKNEYLVDCEDPSKYEMYDYFHSIHNEYKKDTLKIIENNKWVFEDIKKAERINFYGFGFGNADIEYLREIIKNSNSQIQIYLCNHQYNRDLKKIKKKLKECGYDKKIFKMEI